MNLIKVLALTTTMQALGLTTRHLPDLMMVGMTVAWISIWGVINPTMTDTANVKGTIRKAMVVTSTRKDTKTISTISTISTIKNMVITTTVQNTTKKYQNHDG